MTKTVTYQSDEIEVTFCSAGTTEDYGVPNSPTSWVPSDIEVYNLHILGEAVEFKSLPKNLQEAILSLSEDFMECEWE